MKTITIEELTAIRDALQAGAAALSALISDVEDCAASLFPTTEHVEVIGGTDEAPTAPSRVYDKPRSPRTCRNLGYVKKHHIVERIMASTGESRKAVYYVLNKEAAPGDLVYLGRSNEQYSPAKTADRLTRKCIARLIKRNG